MIPQQKSAAVARALREAFDVAEFEDIRDLSGGLGSNPVFRIVVRGSAFLLRINLRAGDLARHFANMKSASEAGLTPQIRYTNIEDRIAITDFVESSPFTAAEALVRMPASLRTLHALPPFGPVPNHINTTCMFLMNPGPALDGFVEKFRAANTLPTAETAELFALYAQIAAVYACHDGDAVSSHNDLKPENIVFDGRRVWLIDWEAAFRNDRYNDLAVMANFVVRNEAEEAAYLQEYFGQPPDEYQLARYFVMQQLVHIFYTMGYLWLGSSGKPVDLSENAPEFRDFHRRLWTREVDLRDKQMKTLYGRVHWEQLLRNTRQARFREALKILSARHSRALPASRF